MVRLGSFLNVFVHLFRLDRGGVDRSIAVCRDTFWRRELRIGDGRRRDIKLNFAVLDAASTDSPLATGVVGVLAWRVLGFGVGHVEHVVLVDENPAWPSELFPGAEKLSILIEDRDPAVAAVGDKESPLTVEGKHVRALEFSVARDQIAEGLDELSVLVVLHNARIADTWRVAFGDEGVTVRRKSDSRRPVERIRPRAALARLAQSHQNSSVRRHFKDLIAFAFFRVAVNRPDIAFRIR